MLITIYDPAGNPKAELSPDDSSTQVREVQGDSVLTLSFTHYDHIGLDVDDYADFLGERFWLTEKYCPRQKSEKEWAYDLKLYGVESMIKRLLVIKTVDGEEDPVFTLTAPPRDHVAMIVKCMNEGMGNITDWKVGQVDGTENIVIDYFGKYCDEALKEIAGKVGAEWWVEGQTVNICKCEHGEPVELGYNKGLLSIDPGTADNVKFYTRLYPVGSSRNIDREKYGFTRLQLPGGRKYVEINADRYGRVDHFEQAAFEDIYPRRVGVVSGVRSEVRTGEDGKPFTIYYFTDDSLPFDPNDYMIGGLVIRVSFQEGSELAGLGGEEDGTYFFEVNFNSTTREFEIITIWPYDNDIQLPGDKLVPKAGDRYILWNLRMPDEYYALAEEEFLAAVDKYNAEHSLDISVYKAPTDHVWIEDHNIELTLGRRVRLQSAEYFPETGYRDIRITKITRKVNLPSQMDIEISDALSRTSQEKMADSISDVRGYARSLAESVSLPDIIRTGDNTRWTDNNLVSARRIKSDFISRINNDTVQGRIDFKNGLTTGNYVRGLSGSRTDAAGNCEVESLYSRSYLKVMELIYNRLNALEGEFAFSDSGTVEQAAANDDGTVTALMRKRWDSDFTAFQPGDVVYGYVNTLTAATAKEYGKAWARVTAVDRAANTLTLVMYDDEDVPSGRNMDVGKGMVIARWGNAITPSAQAYTLYPEFIEKKMKDGITSYRNTRQWCMVISAEEGNIRMMDGVTRPIVGPADNVTASVLGRIPEGLLDDETAALINPGQPYLYARGIVVQDLIRIGYKGVAVRTPNFRGAWSAQTAQDAEKYYRMADDISDVTAHGGCLWQCAVSHASASEPSDSNPDWIRLTAMPAQDWRIIPSANVIYIRTGSHSTDTLSVTVRRYGDGITDYSTPEDLDETGTKLMFSLDGIEYSEFWVRQGETVAGLELEDGGSLDMGGNNVPWLEITDNIHLSLVDAASGETLTSYLLPVVKDGEDGQDGVSVRGDFYSTVFRRSDNDLTVADTPIGGTYQSPLPDGGLWSDGIPSGDGRIWASSRLFKGDGSQTLWSQPRLMADTPDYDVEFSAVANPQPPAGHPNTNGPWHDPSETGVNWSAMLWRAESWKRSGKWTQWTVMPVRGEKGADGSDGSDGASVEVRYRIVDGYPESVELSETERARREPSGWSLTHPVVPSTKSLWRIEASITSGRLTAGTLWSVPVMASGRPGKDGVGLDGKDGPVVYPAGVYDKATVYTSTERSCPYVMDGRQNGMGVYYMLRPGKSYCGAEKTASRDTPTKDYALSDSDTVWERMDGFRSLFAEVLMARFARLGEAVFYDEWMFSAMGTDSGGNPSSDYGKFGDASDPFVPNLQIDLYNGDIIARRGDFYGYVRQKSTVITQANVGRYLRTPHTAGEDYIVDWRKTGPSVSFEGTWNLATGADGATESLYLYMPISYRATQDEWDDIRTYAGMTATVYNHTSVPVLTFMTHVIEDRSVVSRTSYSGNEYSTAVPSGHCMGMRSMLVPHQTDGMECIAWEITGNCPLRAFNR